MSDAVAPAQDFSSGDLGTETEFIDTTLDLLLLLLMEERRWLCMENTQKVLHLTFGNLIQKWLDVQVADLTRLEYSTSVFLRSPSGMVEFCISIHSL